MAMRGETAEGRRIKILAWKDNLLFGVLSLLVTVFITAVAHTLILVAVRRVEQADLANAQIRVLSELRQAQEVLDTTCQGWAFWKAMHAYVDTRDPDFEAENLTEDALKHVLKLDAMGIFDRNGEILWLGVWGQTRGGNNREEMAGFLKELMTADRRERLLARRRGTAGMTGILRAPMGWIILAARPILPANEPGEPNGFLVMGRRADDAWRAQRIKEVGLTFEMREAGPPSVSALKDGWRWYANLRHWRRCDREVCRLRLPVPGEWPGSLLVEVIYPRGLMRSAARAARSITGVLFGSVLALFLTWMWVLRRQVRALQQDRLRMEQELEERRRKADEMREQAFALLNNTDQLRQRLERIAADQRQMSIQMQDAATRARILFESDPLPVLLLSPAAAVILQANRAAADCFGARVPEDLLAHHPLTLSPLRQPEGQESARRWKEWERESARPQGVTFPWRFRRLDGQEFDAEVTAVAFETAGRRLMAVFIQPSRTPGLVSASG